MTTSFSWTHFIPTEVDVKYRQKFFDDMGIPKYAVEVDIDTNRYKRDTVRLITDPIWYSRLAYVLYDAKSVENLQWLVIKGYLIDHIDFVEPNRVMTIY